LGARGNRLVGVARLGVAFVATAAVALGQALPASAQEAAPASSAEATPAETASADTPSTTTAAEHTSTQSAPADATPTAPAKEPETRPETKPDVPAPADTKPANTEPAPESTPSSSTTSSDTTSASTPAETAPAASEPAAVPKDAVKLEPTAAPAAPAAAPPAAPAPQPVAPAPSAPPSPTIVLQVESAAEPEPSEAANTEAATGATALIVTIRPRAGIYLLPAEEPAVKTVRSIRKARTTGKQLVQGTCARPAARVPLSELCVEARAFAVLRATFTASPTPEVRAAMERVAARVTARRGEARPSASKAAKKHSVAEVRPTIPFGNSGHGVVNDGFSGSPGSSSSSRLFALAAAPLRVPLPFRLARVRVPSTLPHGVIAAPPTARPG
jgi:hypothetical protein